jgi:hypothetical protein
LLASVTTRSFYPRKARARCTDLTQRCGLHRSGQASGIHRQPDQTRSYPAEADSVRPPGCQRVGSQAERDLSDLALWQGFQPTRLSAHRCMNILARSFTSPPPVEIGVARACSTASGM